MTKLILSNIPSVMCIIGSIICFYRDPTISGWGWFLFVGMLLAHNN